MAPPGSAVPPESVYEKVTVESGRVCICKFTEPSSEGEPFKLGLFDGSQLWSHESKYADHVSERLNVSVTRLSEWLKDVFYRNGAAVRKELLCSLAVGGEGVTTGGQALKVLKVLQGNTGVVTVASLGLRLCTEKEKSSFLEGLVEQKNMYKNQSDADQTMIKKLEGELEESREVSKEATENAQAFEDDFIRNVLVVLNSKKRKVRELVERVQALETEVKLLQKELKQQKKLADSVAGSVQRSSEPGPASGSHSTGSQASGGGAASSSLPPSGSAAASGRIAAARAVDDRLSSGVYDDDDDDDLGSAGLRHGRGKDAQSPHRGVDADVRDEGNTDDGDLVDRRGVKRPRGEPAGRDGVDVVVSTAAAEDDGDSVMVDSLWLDPSRRAFELEMGRTRRRARIKDDRRATAAPPPLPAGVLAAGSVAMSSRPSLSGSPELLHSQRQQQQQQQQPQPQQAPPHSNQGGSRPSAPPQRRGSGTGRHSSLPSALDEMQ